MTAYDSVTDSSRTVRFLTRGDSYGETCLMNNQPRDSTAISKENVELLAIRHDVIIILQPSCHPNSVQSCSTLSGPIQPPLPSLTPRPHPIGFST